MLARMRRSDSTRFTALDTRTGETLFAMSETARKRIYLVWYRARGEPAWEMVFERYASEAAEVALALPSNSEAARLYAEAWQICVSSTRWMRKLR